VTLDIDTDSDGIGNFYDTDDDGDIMPDDWEVANGFDPLDPADAMLDEDGDGSSNLTEYTAGTDPLNSADFPAGSLDANHITVADVTPDGFSVIWQVDEPSTGDLAIYDSADVLLSDVFRESESEFHPPAEDIGVMKVRVTGLQPDTTYRFQTLTIAKADGLAVFTPAYPQLMEVTTESATVVVNNDPVKQMIYDEDGNPGDGALLLASVEGGDYPVSAWVGQDVETPWARIDLNQVYSALTHENLQLMGGEEMSLWSIGGVLGNYVNMQKVQPQANSNHTAIPDFAYLSPETGLDVNLKIDLNIIGFLSHSTHAMTAYDLLLYLKEQAGDPSVVDNITRYNKQTGIWETASWFEGEPAGLDFQIEPDESYLVYMKQDMDNVWFEGIACGANTDLAPGLNLVSLPSPNGFPTFTSYEMLQSLGDASQVSSVQRYDDTYGWQTTSWFAGVPSGVNFDARLGEGYLIYMNEEKENWRPY